MVGSDDISQWQEEWSWTPQETFDAYVKELNGTRHTTTKGDYEVTYVYGGVDWTNVDLETVVRDDLAADDRTAADAVIDAAAATDVGKVSGAKLDGATFVTGSVPSTTSDDLGFDSPLGRRLSSFLGLLMRQLAGLAVLILLVLLYARWRRRRWLVTVPSTTEQK